jgi:release factor glutamine methyltransferase
MAVGEVLRYAAVRIGRLEARALLAHVLERDAVRLVAHPEAELGKAEHERFEGLVERRLRGEPLAYLTGEREFYGRMFKVSPAVLVPRPETECLIELVLPRLPAQPPARVLDLGTGSGCIAITIASECLHSAVTAVDVSAAALELAQENARRLGVSNVRFLSGHWYAPLGNGAYDAIVSNPPYVADRDPHLARGDLRFEPCDALSAGTDGLACIREVVDGAAAHLKPGGWLLFEHGYDQGERARALLKGARFEQVTTWHDLAGHERVSGGQLTRGPHAARIPDSFCQL